VSGCIGIETPPMSQGLLVLCFSQSSIVTAIGKTVRAGGVRQVVVELDGAFLCVGAAGPGTCIGVLADREADPRQIGFEMQRCVTAVVRELSTPSRGAADGAVAAARARS